MKKNIAVFVIGLVTLIVSCKKDDSSAGIITTTAVNSTVISGNWRITYYWDTDHEETNNFSGYVFTFSSGGTITAVKPATTVTGTWATGTDDSKVKLIVAFATPSIFQELSDDWHVTERTDTKIKLTDVSGGNGGTDYLTFERN